MAGRFIGENIRLIYDLLDITDSDNIPGLLVLISTDFEKASVSVSHEFILNLFGSILFWSIYKKKWIKTFYNQDSSSILVNAFLSESFKIERGCRQGDGLSPYLFLLCEEVLAMMVCNDEDLKGIKVADKGFRLSQYTDDNVLFIDGSEKSPCRLHLKPMHNIGKVSVNASILYNNQEICNKTNLLFLLRENSKNTFSIFVFILMAGVFVSRDENSLLDLISLIIRKR